MAGLKKDRRAIQTTPSRFSNKLIKIIGNYCLAECYRQSGRIGCFRSGSLYSTFELGWKKKSSRLDSIPNAFLKGDAEWISKYLCLPFNRSLSLRTTPKDWKIAKVIPICKPGNKSEPSNYRPISLTCTVGKLHEHIILKHLTNHLEYKILSPFQHGFRQNMPMVVELIELVHDISSSIDHQKQIDLILLDFSKAFDQVSHKKLIMKLQFTLGKGKILDWITNSLTDRSQFI